MKRAFLPALLLSISSPALAQLDLAATCPGGTVIELDGQITCEKEDSQQRRFCPAMRDYLCSP